MSRITPSPHDWPEDFADDNGCYYHVCIHCDTQFTAHKRRPNVCRVCHNTDATEAKRRAEWLDTHHAPKDWVVLTKDEVAKTKADLVKLVWDNSEMKRALEDIHTTAHCLAKAGPLHTPDLATAWVRFMEISVKATAALSAAKQKESGI